MNFSGSENHQKAKREQLNAQKTLFLETVGTVAISDSVQLNHQEQ